MIANDSAPLGKNFPEGVIDRLGKSLISLISFPSKNSSSFSPDIFCSQSVLNDDQHFNEMNGWYGIDSMNAVPDQSDARLPQIFADASFVSLDILLSENSSRVMQFFFVTFQKFEDPLLFVLLRHNTENFTSSYRKAPLHSEILTSGQKF